MIRPADKIGALRDKIASLEVDLEYEKTLLKNKGIITSEGAKYCIAIKYDVHRSTTDWKTIAMLSKPSRATIVANTSLTLHDRVHVSLLANK